LVLVRFLRSWGGGGGGGTNRLFRSFFFHISFFIPSIPTVYFRHFTAGDDFVFKFYSKQPNSKAADKKELHPSAYSLLSFIAKDLQSERPI